GSRFRRQGIGRRDRGIEAYVAGIGGFSGRRSCGNRNKKPMFCAGARISAPEPGNAHYHLDFEFMKVTVERSELVKSLSHVHRVVERRNTIPILANVLIRADGATLALKATDLDLEVIETIAAEASPGGSTTVPAHMFHDIVRKLPEGAQIVLEASGDRAVLSIRAGRSRF